MKTRLILTVLGAVVLLFAVYYAVFVLAADYEIIDNGVYRVDPLLGTKRLVKTLYDRDFYAKNYERQDDTIYLKNPETKERYPIRRHFEEGFEDAATLGDLISVERGWTNFTLQSPQARTVSDYNALRKRILSGESGFLDNRLEPTAERAHSGQRALKAHAVAPAHGMVCCKSSLHTPLMHFVKGDDVWFAAWYYFERMGEFNTVMDLESTFVEKSPGMRICLRQGVLECELAKWLPKRLYQQTSEKSVRFPAKHWVRLKLHLRLSDQQDGIVRLWQDDQLVLDHRGQTLPFAEAVYNDLEIGLSAHSVSDTPATLYVDDVVISDGRVD